MNFLNYNLELVTTEDWKITDSISLCVVSILEKFC